MNEFAEALKGYTDVPIAVICAVLGIISARKNKELGVFYFITAAAAFLGAAVHSFDLGRVWSVAVWVILHPLLFEAVRRFSQLFCSYIAKEKVKKYAMIYVIEAVLLMAAEVFLFFKYGYDILFFAAFAVLMLLRPAVCLAKTKNAPKKAYVFVALLAIPILLQIFSPYIPYAVPAEHCFIISDLFFAYAMLK